MNLYQELQLNQAGSKALIKGSRSVGEKRRHIAAYAGKLLLTQVFCVVFVFLFGLFFGKTNGIAGVVVLLSVMVFRQADLGIRASHGSGVLLGIFGILILGPRLANMLPAGPAFAVNAVCIFLIAVSGCHNIVMYNHATLVLSYLLLMGNDVTGKTYLMRAAGLGLGGIWVAWVHYRNHRKKVYKRSVFQVLEEFDFSSSRTRWQLKIALAVSSAILMAQMLNFSRVMWVGIAVMSVTQPLPGEKNSRLRERFAGSAFGSAMVSLICLFLPESGYGLMGMLGGVGVGLSATYLWQTTFNTFGALSAAAGIFGIAGAVLVRLCSNLFGVLYAALFDRIYLAAVEWLHGRRKREWADF